MATAAARDGDARVDSLLGEELPEHARPTVARALRVVAVWLVLWLVPVVALLIALGQANVFSQIAVFFSKMAMVTFGGAYAVLAYVAQQAVEHYRWLKPGEMLDGLGMAETTPGPLIMVLQFVGFMAAYRDPGALSPMLAGTLGGLLATWVTFTPVLPLDLPRRAVRREAARQQSACRRVVGDHRRRGRRDLQSRDLVRAPHRLPGDRRRCEAFPLSFDMPVLTSVDIPALVLAVAAAAAIFRFKMGMITRAGGSCAAGILLRLFGGRSERHRSKLWGRTKERTMKRKLMQF